MFFAYAETEKNISIIFRKRRFKQCGIGEYTSNFSFGRVRLGGMIGSGLSMVAGAAIHRYMGTVDTYVKEKVNNYPG